MALVIAWWAMCIQVIGLSIIGCSSQVTQNDCSNNVETCRHDCSPSELKMFQCSKQNSKPTSYTPLSLDGGRSFCCPGYFKTINGKCQECRDHQFMPDINKCCECLPCTECDNIQSDTMKVRCNSTSNIVCTIELDPTTNPTSTCPLTDVPTTDSPIGIFSSEVPTTELGNETPKIPLESKSEWTSREKGFFAAFLGLLIILLVLVIFCASCCCYYYVSDRGRDEPDAASNPTWKDITSILEQKTDESPNNQSLRVVMEILANRGRDEPDAASNPTWKDITSILKQKTDESPNNQSLRVVMEILANQTDPSWRAVMKIVRNKIGSTVRRRNGAATVVPPQAPPVAPPVVPPVAPPVVPPVVPPVDAPEDAPEDAPVDAPVVPPVDAPEDAPEDAPVDAPVVPPVDVLENVPAAGAKEENQSPRQGRNGVDETDESDPLVSNSNAK